MVLALVLMAAVVAALVYRMAKTVPVLQVCRAEMLGYNHNATTRALRMNMTLCYSSRGQACCP